MGRLIDVDKFLKRVKKDREHEIYLHSWTADMVLERLDSWWYAPTVKAIPKADYENRLRADMVAILTELQVEIEECVDGAEGSPQLEQGVEIARCQVVGIIQQKINELKAKSMDVVEDYIADTDKKMDSTTKNDLGIKCISREQALEPYRILEDTDTLSVYTIRQNFAELPSIGRYDPYTDKFIKE